MRNNQHIAQQIFDSQAFNSKVSIDYIANIQNIANQQEATKKHLEQELQLGLQDFFGRGIAKDIEKAKESLKRGVGLGHVSSQIMLGICYELCYKGTSFGLQDFNESFRWFVKGAEFGGGLDGKLLMAVFYASGQHTPIYDAQVYKILEELATEARNYLLRFIVSRYETSANKGDTVAQFKVASALEEMGGPVNLTRAALLFETAARAGHIQAQHEIARYYEQGIVVKKDVKTAAAWYERAARLGDHKSQYQWALFLIRHPSIKNLELAASWLRVASLNDAIASDCLKQLLSEAPQLSVIKSDLPDLTDKAALSKLVTMTTPPNTLLRERDELLENHRTLSQEAIMNGFSIDYEALPIAGDRIAYSVQKMNGHYRFCLEHWDPYLLKKVTLSKEITRSHSWLNCTDSIRLQVPGRENTLVEFNPNGILSVKILEGQTHIAFSVRSTVPLNAYNTQTAALDIIKVSEIRRNGKIHLQSDNALPFDLSCIESLENVGIEANQIHYQDNTFRVSGELEILYKKAQNISQPIYTPGSMSLVFSEQSKDPSHILTDLKASQDKEHITTAKMLKDCFSISPEIILPIIFSYLGKSSHQALSIKSNSPLVLGSAVKLINLEAFGKVEIQTPFLDLNNASLKSGTEVMLDAPQMKLGRLVGPLKNKSPSSILSSGKTTFTAKQKLEMEGLHIYSGGLFTINSPNPVDNLSTDITVRDEVVLNTPHFVHRQAFINTGPSLSITSIPARFRVSKSVCISGEITVIGASELSCQRIGDMINQVWKDKKPQLKSIAEYQTVTRQRMETQWKTGALGIKHSPRLVNKPYSERVSGTIHAPIISIASKIQIDGVNINIFGVMSVLAIDIKNFDKLYVGRQAVILQPAARFRSQIPLLEGVSFNPLFEPRMNAFPFIMQPLIPVSTHIDLSHVCVLTDGQLKPYDGSIPILPHPLQEEKDIVDKLMKGAGRHFIDENSKNPEALLAWVKYNAWKLYKEGLSLKTIQEPVLYYKEITYIFQTGQSSQVLTPIVKLPKSWNNTKRINSGAYLYALEGIDIHGNGADSIFTLTGSLESEGTVAVYDVNRVHIEKPVYQKTERVANTYRKDSMLGGDRVCHELSDITTSTPVDGGDIKANLIDMNNVSLLHIQGAELFAKKTMDFKVGKIDVVPIIASWIQHYNNHASNRCGYKEADESLLRHAIIPANLSSPEGTVSISAGVQRLNALACAARKLHLEATQVIEFPTTTITERAPTQYVSKGLRSSTITGEYQKGITASLQAEEIMCVSKGNIYMVGTEMLAISIELIADKGITAIPLILKQWFQTSSTGLRGLSLYAQNKSESHEYGIVPSFYARQNIKMTTQNNHVVLVGPRLCAGETLEFSTPNGTVSILPAVFHHDISSTEFSVGLSFFGSQMIEGLIQKDFRQAALGMLREFPLLASMEALMKKESGAADKIGNGMKALYYTYKLYKDFAKSSLKDFACKPINTNVKLRFGTTDTQQSWTDLPYLGYKPETLSLKLKICILKAHKQNAKTYLLLLSRI